MKAGNATWAAVTLKTLTKKKLYEATVWTNENRYSTMAGSIVLYIGRRSSGVKCIEIVNMEPWRDSPSGQRNRQRTGPGAHMFMLKAWWYKEISSFHLCERDGCVFTQLKWLYSLNEVRKRKIHFLCMIYMAASCPLKSAALVQTRSRAFSICTTNTDDMLHV
jgi:hypothetical protein